MKHIVMGIVAHVDAGKTTLSESLLYTCGTVRKLGRVDHGDAFLDTESQEKQRGITIHAHQAELQTERMSMTLLDTPGHVDFAAETERTLEALDYAILVISAVDGIQSHTQTLWKLLQTHHIPTILVLNKIDAPNADVERTIAQIQQRFSETAVVLPIPEADTVQLNENDGQTVAMASEEAMEYYLEHQNLSLAMLQQLIADCLIFPIVPVSALKLQGIDTLIRTLETYTLEPQYPQDFGARVIKISHDGTSRITWLKVTGGELQAKAELTVQSQGKLWHEKADQLRSYNGAKYEVVQGVQAGYVCAAVGLEHTYPGLGLGKETSPSEFMLQPVLTYRVLSQEGETFDDVTLQKVVQALRVLEDEDPLLALSWQQSLREVHVQLMGEIQLEIIEQELADRFKLHVRFDAGSVLYKETIHGSVRGIGHFEPLRHYAEVHVLLEAAPRGSGVHAQSTVPVDDLALNWQRLVMTHALEKEHKGVLIGAPLTDVNITLVAGRAHLKHTEGGDFREATYRAIRQGLMQAREETLCVLLEPWYSFEIRVSQSLVGRVMADVQRMAGELNPVDQDGTDALVTGSAPVATMRNYPLELATISHGEGMISLQVEGYRECHNASDIIENSSYEPERDIENTPDSVFCAHGAGYPVAWYKVPEFAHLL